MEYPKVANLLDSVLSASNKPSKFRTISWVEINDDIDIVMRMYNLIEYSDNYSESPGSLWQYCKEIPAVNNDDNVVDFNGANATD